MGRKYEVPADLTILKAMEYAGYKFIRGCGCRGGFCGACTTIYRVEGDYKMRMALACQEMVKDRMYISQMPFTPANKPIYDLKKLKPSVNAFLEYYPEIAKCVSCNTCTKSCPQDIEVMNYVQAALRGDLIETANLSFDCVTCGLCATRCPAEIVPYNVGLMARRLCGKYVLPQSKQIGVRVDELKKQKFHKEIQEITDMDIEDLKKTYQKREIEKD